MRINKTSTQDEIDRASVRRDALIENLKSKTPEQIGDYIDTHVTDLASAKQVLKALAKMVGYLARKL